MKLKSHSLFVVFYVEKQRYFSYLLLIGDQTHTLRVLRSIATCYFHCCHHYCALMANDSSSIIKRKIRKSLFKINVISCFEIVVQV